MESLTQNETFLKHAYQRALIPCILSILSGNINILVDGILVGQKVGVNGLAAISLCVPLYLVLCIAGSFFVSGTAIPAARYMGNQQQESMQRLYRTAIASCLLISVIITAAGLVCLNPIVAFLCGEEAVRPYVAAYAGVTLAGALPKIMIYIPFWYLRLEGRNKSVTLMMVVMGAGNVVLDLIFLYTLNMGVFGAGLASVIATAAACVIGFLCLCRRDGTFRLGLTLIRDRDEWKRIAQAGSPSALNNLLQTLRVLAVNGLLLRFGGSRMVAAFTAVNCICAFSQSITDGVPQAASAMLGVYSGEHDSGSAGLLVRREWKSGLACSAVFAAVIIAAADLIAGMYGLDVPLRFAMLCLGLGMFPGLLNSILSGYYNISGQEIWANGIIFARVFLLAAASLAILLLCGQNPWWFLLVSEALTLAGWYLATALFHRLHPDRSRFLLMDSSLEREGRVLNFSVKGSVDNICEASDKISGFCEENGMNPGQVMRISLALEEIMTLILQRNGDGAVTFDARSFALQGKLGIRIHYDGIPFNPFSEQEQEGREDQFMGIRMIKNLVREFHYQKTFGLNTIQIHL